MGNTSQYILRALGTADAAAAAALIRRAFAAQALITDPPPSALGETEEGVAAVLAVGGGTAAVDPAMDRLVGAVLWHPEPGGLYLSRLSVDPDWRGRGIARALVASVDAAAQAHGAPRVRLSTRLVLVDNRRLFANCGFIEGEVHAHPGYAHPTFVDLEKVVA